MGATCTRLITKRLGPWWRFICRTVCPLWNPSWCTEMRCEVVLFCGRMLWRTLSSGQNDWLGDVASGVYFWQVDLLSDRCVEAVSTWRNVGNLTETFLLLIFTNNFHRLIYYYVGLSTTGNVNLVSLFWSPTKSAWLWTARLMELLFHLTSFRDAAHFHSQGSRLGLTTQLMY